MKVASLLLPQYLKDHLTSEGISELYPPQEQAVLAGLLERNSILLATPTASGKTLTALMAIAKALEAGGKAIYVVPLKALAEEKYHEFRFLKQQGYGITLETGDLDAKNTRNRAFDVMIATAEKCDSIIRSNPKRLHNVTTLILDEIHLIGSNRGPVYEVIAALFKSMNPAIQVLGLSATVGNAVELADWLNATPVESAWRPVTLTEDVRLGGSGQLWPHVKQALKDGGQALVFVNSRRSAEAEAERLGQKLELKDKHLAQAADKILAALSQPTSQCRRQAACIQKGVAFHHAGLVYKQRAIIEDAFKKGFVKVIVATPTLAAGVNLPSRTVIIRDLKRYTAAGLDYIPIFEYKQMAGRAGRPKYDTAGTAVSLARTQEEQEFINEHYLRGRPEPITSRFGRQPVLRFHTLAAIASHFTPTPKALNQYVESTFFGHQYGLNSDVHLLLGKVVDKLTRWGFITSDQRLCATPLGSRIAQLYIDPSTAHTYITTLPDTPQPSWLGLLEIVCDATELPLLPVKRSQEAGLWEDAWANEPNIYRDLSGFGIDWQFLNRYKTARLFTDWIGEATEEQLFEAYGTAPGQLYQLLTNIQWLCYAAAELARIKRLPTTVPLKKLETMLAYGVPEKLLPLVSIKNIGRVRARKLYDNGMKTPEDVGKEPLANLSNLLGVKTAQKIKSSLSH